MRQRSVLFLAIIAAVTAMSSAANAGGWGWGGCGGCGGCNSAYYTTGLIACDSHRFYVVNQGPTYSGPGIITYPTYTARSYPYVGGCGYGSCYRFSHTRPAGHYDHHRYHHRGYYHHRHGYDVRPRYRYDSSEDYGVRPRRAPRVVYIDGPRRHHTTVQYRGPKHPTYRTKRYPHPLPLPPK